jgi:hypothetical protein
VLCASVSVPVLDTVGLSGAGSALSMENAEKGVASVLAE